MTLLEIPYFLKKKKIIVSDDETSVFSRPNNEMLKAAVGKPRISMTKNLISK
jgi:hypothetical protein